MLLLFSKPAAQSSANRGQLRVYINSAWTIKPVKVWDGSNWVKKNVRYWNGSTWVFTFDTAYTIVADTNDTGFFTGNGATENSSDPGFYDIQGNAAREDSSEPGTYIN